MKDIITIIIPKINIRLINGTMIRFATIPIKEIL